jgi:LAS superfamily LD-carboxypeptidase LdcB
LIGGSYPSPDQLIQAPITDFFDPTRDIGLLSLERQTYAAYKTMLHAAANDLKGSVNFTKDGELAPGEKFLTIVSGYRSREYQESLRRKEPTAGRAALAKFSVHSTGRAIDMYVGGEPVTTKDANRMLQVQTPVYKWLVKNAAKFGFVPYFYEPWHWEYVGTLAASK